MNAQDSINTFVDAMIDSKEKFEKLKAEFNRKNDDVTGRIQGFRQEITQILQQRIEVEDEELQKLFDGVTSELKRLLDNVTDSMEKTQKGMRFISEYEQSFNVAVFGKVKAGKSYLGNFIMGNSIRDLGIKTSYDKLERPKVIVYDRGKVNTQEKLAELSEEGRDGFRVDPNEATSAIQLFKLGGLTWFDTPGIGSITSENEMLAKDYVDNADLVVYTSNSDAAGTRQDFMEMKELYEKGKAFLLLLTQSDSVDEDCDEEGDIISTLIPKSDEDRRDTENYMCSTLQEIGITNLIRGKEILTVSTKLAMTALEQKDEAMFEDSNIGKFLGILTDITKNEGADLKMKTPVSRINATIAEIVGQLRNADKELEAYSESLKQKQKELSERSELVSVQMQQECMKRIGRIIRRKSSEVEESGENFSGDELGELLSREVYDVLLKTCAGEFASSSSVLSQYADKIQMNGVGGLKMRTDTIEYTVKEVKRVEREPKGIWENVCSFFGKTYYGHKAKDVKKYSSIQLGINEQQTMALARDQLNILFEEAVPGLMEKISNHFMEPLMELQQKASRSIRGAAEALERLKC